MAMRILILGGGVGGQVVANELRHRLSPEHRVTLIDRDTRHAFAPSFLWVMTGDRQPQRVTRDVRELVRPGVEVIQTEIRGIDVANWRVEMDYDAHPQTHRDFGISATSRRRNNRFWRWDMRSSLVYNGARLGRIETKSRLNDAG